VQRLSIVIAALATLAGTSALAADMAVIGHRRVQDFPFAVLNGQQPPNTPHGRDIVVDCVFWGLP